MTDKRKSSVKRTRDINFYVYRAGKPNPSQIKYPAVMLFRDNWDDYGYNTLFVAYLNISENEEVPLGAVKIGVGKADFTPQVPCEFTEFPKGVFSLGQSVAYYRTLKKMVPPTLRRKYLKTIGDVVASPELLTGKEESAVWDKSFLRDAAARHALRRGGFYIDTKHETVPAPKFEFSMLIEGASKEHRLKVDFSPHKRLPNRVLLLIGRNGAGKTTALSTLAYALAPGDNTFDENSLSGVALECSVSPPPSVSRVIAISYNAFDEFPLPPKAGRNTSMSYRSKLSYKYCGLRNLDGVIDTQEMNRMMDNTIERLVGSDRETVLKAILSRLVGNETAEALCDLSEDRDEVFRRMSAGQRLVTSIASDIVGFIEEGSILLLDEPETCLHPGLLTSMIIAVQDILEEFDSYAIISTHSPILLQQVPSRYVRFFRRNGSAPSIEELRIESFGEDLGELSRSVLGLADPEKDYTHVLRSMYEEMKSVEAVEDCFEKPLGLPAKAFLYSLDQDGD